MKMTWKNISEGVNPLGPSSRVKHAIRKAIKRLGASADDEQAAAAKLIATKHRVAETSVLLSDSFRELIFAAPGLSGSRTVMIVGPAPRLYREAAEASAADVSLLSAGPRETDIPGLQEWESLPGTDAGLIMLSNPSRVTGLMMTPDQVKEVIRAAAERGWLVIIDISLTGFAGDPFPSLDRYDLQHVLFVGTTALYYGLQGLELAFMISAPERVAEWRRRWPRDINLLALAAARAAMKDRAFHRRTGEFIAQERRMIERSFRKCVGTRVRFSSSNVYLLESDDANRTGELLRRAGYRAERGGEIEGLGPACFVLSIQSHDQNLKLVRRLGRGGL